MQVDVHYNSPASAAIMDGPFLCFSSDLAKFSSDSSLKMDLCDIFVREEGKGAKQNPSVEGNVPSQY